MSKQAFLLALIIITMVAFYGGYLYGNKVGYENGEAKTRALLQRAQATTSPNATVTPSPENASANPFDKIQFNPFK